MPTINEVTSVRLADGKEMEVRIEGLWIEVYGKSWMFSDGNPAAIIYAIRNGVTRLPIDDKVWYVKDQETRLGHLVHESEFTTNNEEDRA